MRAATSSAGVLSVILLSSVLAVSGVGGAHADVSASLVEFDRTSVVEFENSGEAEIKKFMMWLGDGIAFTSFKTEKSWTGTKTPHGLLIFETTSVVQAGERVKFGVKTDAGSPGINWSALDPDDGQIGIGKVVASAPPPPPPPEPDSDGPGAIQDGVLPGSSFRLIPKDPNVGAAIRVVGEHFGADQQLDFYIDGRSLHSFSSDQSGRFVFTSKVPDDAGADMADFAIRDAAGNEKTLSVRLGEAPAGPITIPDVPLEITGIPGSILRGNEIAIGGTGNRGSSVTITITDPDGETITTERSEIDGGGAWSYSTVIPIDAALGEYSVDITDGAYEERRTVTVESGQKIRIEPAKLKVEPGEPMVFNGTAIPNESLFVSVENPRGTIVFSDTISVGASGVVGFEVGTTLSDLQGTYILFASHEESSAITLIGLGEIPESRLIVKSKQLNYNIASTARFTIDGPPDSTVSLIIIDPSDKRKVTDSVKLGPDGRNTYELHLRDYSSGIYEVVITRGNAQAKDLFSVGLVAGSEPITVQTTKLEYLPGEQILVLGEGGATILVTLTMIDPDGERVKVKETFTDKEGKISDDSFRVPSDAAAGAWVMEAKSGANLANAEFTVSPTVQEGMSVLVSDRQDSPNGEQVTIEGFNAAKSKQIAIEIVSADDEVIQELEARATGSGKFSVLWIVPEGTVPGTYTIRASDGSDSAETTTELG